MSTERDSGGEASTREFDRREFPTARAFGLVNDAHTTLCVAGSELEYPRGEDKNDRIGELEDEAREAVMNLLRAMADERGFNDEEFENVYLDRGSEVWADGE